MDYMKHVETRRGKKLKHGVFAQMDIYTKIAFIATEVLWLIMGLILLFSLGMGGLVSLIAVLIFWLIVAIILFLLVTKQNKEYEMSSVKVLSLKIRNAFYRKQVYRNTNYTDNVEVRFMGNNQVREVFEKEAKYKQVRHERLRGSVKY